MPLALVLRDPLSASNAHCSAISHKKGSPNARSQKDDLETGLVGGLAYSNGNQEPMTLSTNVSVRFDQNASFVAGTASDSTRFSGNLIGTDDVPGN